ncbi:MAG: hypothetical protein ABI185_08090 [Ginsengibacter sp.]
MQNLSITLVYLLLFKISFGVPTTDTSGVYPTKTDFLSNILRYKTASNIPTPTFPLFAKFVVSREAFTIHIKGDGKNIKTFSPGSFYAFNNNGVKYLYLKKSNEYVAVVNDAPPVFMIVQKKVHFSGSIAFADDIYLYTTNLDEPFKVFSRENIIADFKANKKAMDLLLELRQKIIKEGYDAEIHKKAFLECRKMVGIYMDKIKRILENG